MSNRSYLSFVFLVILLCASYAHAQSVTVSIPKDLTALPNESGVKVPVNVTDLTDLGVISANLNISYDTKVLTATNVTVTDTIAQESIVTPNINDINGTISIAIARAQPFSGSGTIIFIVFDVDSDNPNDSSSLVLTQVSLNSGRVKSATDNGKITIVDTPSDGMVTLSIPKNLVFPPGTTTIKAPVNISDVAGLGIISADITLSYDKNVLAATDATLTGTIAEGGYVLANSDNAKGAINIGLIYSTPESFALSGSGVLVYINFNVISNKPHDISSLSLVQASLNSNLDSFRIMKRNGDITVNMVYGDISGDWEVTAYDAGLILQYIVGLELLSAGQIKAGDVSKNGILTALDATLILQYVSGLIQQFK